MLGDFSAAAKERMTVSWRLRFSDKQSKKKKLTFLEVMVIGFAAVIFLGALILMLPVSNADGQWLNFMDALFTATTCVCVTGLVTVTPALQFSIFGKVVLLVLIQIGGWGVIVVGMWLLLLLRMRISVNMRVIIHDYFNLASMSGIVRMLIYVIKASLVVEGLGAVGYMIDFIPRFGFGRGIWFGIFHAVSAFCNAGVDLLGSNSLMDYSGNWWISFVTMALIVIGGLGFAVWIDLTKLLSEWFACKKAPQSVAGSTPAEKSFRRPSIHSLKLQTKLVVILTLALIFGGQLIILMTEYKNPATLGNMTFGQKLLASLFQSVTTRTAGFATISQAGMRDVTKFFSCVLMMIGGSPAGTAGGMKTVTIAVLFLTARSISCGHRDTECFGRKISDEAVRTALLVLLMCAGLFIIGTTAICMLQPQTPVIDCMYEVVSAIATVGLTADLTPKLCTAGRVIIILLMYTGRIGPITLPMFIASRMKQRSNKVVLPEEHIVVG